MTEVYYIPKYATEHGIQRKLRGRLNIRLDDAVPSLYEVSVPSMHIDKDLFYEVIEEQEYLLDLILNQIYELPLSNRHPILKEIVEGLVISELIKIHFQGQSTPSIGADLSGINLETKTHAYNLIQMITAGHNIYIPGVPPVQNMPGVAIPQPLRLPGETPRTVGDEDTITRLYTYIGRRSSNAIDSVKQEIQFCPPLVTRTRYFDQGF
jgi:hypothetical protein